MNYNFTMYFTVVTFCLPGIICIMISWLLTHLGGQGGLRMLGVREIKMHTCSVITTRIAAGK